MINTSRWLSAVGFLCACSGPPVGPIRSDVGTTSDTASAIDAVVDTGASPVDVPDVADADAGMPTDRVDALDVVDVPDRVDVADADVSTDRPDVIVDADVVDAGREDVVPPRPRITFSFVSAALQGSNDAGVRLNAVIQWHGSLRGQSADGGIQFEGVIR